MKALLVHAFVIVTVLFGGDLTLNEGRDTDKLARNVTPAAVYSQVKIQAHHFNDSIAGRTLR